MVKNIAQKIVKAKLPINQKNNIVDSPRNPKKKIFCIVSNFIDLLYYKD